MADLFRLPTCRENRPELTRTECSVAMVDRTRVACAAFFAGNVVLKRLLERKLAAEVIRTIDACAAHDYSVIALRSIDTFFCVASAKRYTNM